MNAIFSLVILAAIGADTLGPGNHTRQLMLEGRERTYLVHVPPKYDPQNATPVVLVFHGAAANAAITVNFTGMNSKADEAGFVAVYPNGTGIGPLQTFNAGGWKGMLAQYSCDDVGYVAKVLDDLPTVINCDPKRIYATGMSNGGMMCYRVAAELSDRIAAIAPVAGTMCLNDVTLKRPLSVMHFHGTVDSLVPIEGPSDDATRVITFKSVDETMKIWAKANGCAEIPQEHEIPDKADDGTKVTRKTYGNGKDGTEVVLFVIDGGGHTWPGRDPRIKFLGKSTQDISANDLMWDFFQKHPMK